MQNQNRQRQAEYWYVPDPRIRTAAAAAEARAIAARISEGCHGADCPEEHELFVAMHTCAFRARRVSRGGRVAAEDRAEWADRWQQVREYIVEQNLGLAYSMNGVST